MSEHYDFHYQPTGSGAISGQQVLQQTEDAINELGDYVNDNVGGAMDVAQQALETAQNAETNAQTALDTANSFSSAIQSAQQDASTALSTAQTAQNTASNANNTAIQASQDASSAVTTANNASGQVSTLSGTVTALGQRVTTAEGNIGQNTSDITALTTRVGTAEGNITTLQNDVSIAQGNASSAMATAGQVKQQAFVFRYSSTALTASSTNSNTLLDNTDNLKVGDKVIDSDGVLFSITAIDTVNSTFTVGSALIDLATDSDVVHTSGNEIINGDKVFNNRLIKNIDVVLGTAPSTGKFSNIDIADNNKTPLLQILSGVYDTGNSYARFFVQNKTADDGSGLSPTGTLRGCGFNISLPANTTSDGQGSITPRANKTTDFGLLSYQWRNLWCEKLYLNGTQLDPSAFVTTDTAQTISGNKTFSSNVNVYNSDSATDTANIILKNSKAERGSTTNIGEQNIFFLDKDNAQIGNIKCEVDSNGYSNLTLQCSDTNDTSSGVQVRKTATGVTFQPISNSPPCYLGQSVRRWYSTYTSKINGLEPSSLSLPSDRSTRIDISSYFTNTGTGDTNTYTVPANGYIYLTLSELTNVHCFSRSSDNVTNYAQTFTKLSNSAGVLYVLFPVRKNDVFVVTWYTATTVSVDGAFFIPCQGNV